MRIATRGSDLALWQAHWVKQALEAGGAADVEIHVVKTQGDVVQDRALTQLEGKGFFTKEIEAALLTGAADVAVHSYKDLPTQQPPELVVAAVPPRASTNDLLIVREEVADSRGETWPLAQAARVGTGAARRIAQLLHMRPDLQVVDLRGNVPTRIRKLRDKEYDAIVLAKAGLDRLEIDLGGMVVVDLRISGFLPAPAQGALAIQCRREDERTSSLLRGLHDDATASCVGAERHLLTLFEGGCSLPLGCAASLDDGSVELRAKWLAGHGDMRTCCVRADDPHVAAETAHRALTS